MKNYGFNSIPISTTMVFAGIFFQILGLVIFFGLRASDGIGFIFFIIGTIFAGLYLKKSSSKIPFSFVAHFMLILNILIWFLFAVLSGIAGGMSFR